MVIVYDGGEGKWLDDLNALGKELKREKRK